MLDQTKIKLAAISLAACALSFFSQSTTAYHRTTEKATNVVNSGNIQFIIHEQLGTKGDLPQESSVVLPGEVIPQKVYIESDCRHPFYLRVKISYAVDAAELNAEECFRVEIDHRYWEFFDGWYYYKGSVGPGETTPCVFSRVEMVGAKLDKRYLGKTLTMTVSAQAVQSENNPLSDGRIHTASGWPAE